MASTQADAIERMFRELRDRGVAPFDLERDRENARESWELTGDPGGVRRERDSMSGILVIRAIPERDRGLFSTVFLHGGEFCLMSAWTRRLIAGHIAKICKAQVILPDYALAPERPYPAAPEDCASVFRAVREEQPERLVSLIGDSAGGGLALSLLLRIRAGKDPPPFAVVLMSPWLDLSLSSPSIKTAADADAVLAERN